MTPVDHHRSITTNDPLMRFFCPAAGLEAQDVLESLTLLLGRAGVRPSSRGLVHRARALDSRTGEPLRGGPLCCAIFGPVDPGRCQCGALSGAAHAGQRCEQCGVEVGDTTGRRYHWGHLDAAVGLVHPRLAGWIGRPLGLSADEVLAVARLEAYLDHGQVVSAPEDADAGWIGDHLDRTSAEHLRGLLGEQPPLDWPADLAVWGFEPQDLVLDHVPVLPPGARQPARSHSGQLMPGPTTRLLQQLIMANNRLVLQLDQQAPDLQLASGYASLQRAFERLCLQLEDQRPERQTWIARPAVSAAWRPAPLPDGPLSVEPADPCLPLACALARDDRLVLQFPYALLVLSRRDGGIIAEQRAPGSRQIALSRDGSKVLIQRERALLSLDLTRQRWAAGWPTELPCLVLDQLDGWPHLVDCRRGRVHPLGCLGQGSAPPRYTLSADGRFIWVEASGGGGIYCTARGQLQYVLGAVDPTQGSAAAAPTPDRQGLLAPPGPAAQRGFEAAMQALGGAPQQAMALALTRRRRWRTLHAGAVLVDDQQVRLRLARPYACAGFSRDGRQLVVADQREALVLQLDPEPCVLERYALTDLAPLLTLRAGGVVGPLRAHRLLTTFGTRRAAARARAEELQTVEGIGPALAKSIKRKLRAPRVVRARCTWLRSGC